MQPKNKELSNLNWDELQKEEFKSIDISTIRKKIARWRIDMNDDVRYKNLNDHSELTSTVAGILGDMNILFQTLEIILVKIEKPTNEKD